MATQLPTITVTDAQAQQLLAIFGNAASYKEWLKRELRTKVIKAKRAEAAVTAQAEADAEFADLLPEPEEEPAE